MTASHLDWHVAIQMSAGNLTGSMEPGQTSVRLQLLTVQKRPSLGSTHAGQCRAVGSRLLPQLHHNKTVAAQESPRSSSARSATLRCQRNRKQEERSFASRGKPTSPCQMELRLQSESEQRSACTAVLKKQVHAAIVVGIDLLGFFCAVSVIKALRPFRSNKGTSTLAFSQSLGDKKSCLLGFPGGVLGRCIFGAPPGCLEHWLMDCKDFFLLLYDGGDLHRLFFCVSCTEGWVAGHKHANKGRAAAIVMSRQRCQVTVLSAQRCRGARKASLSRAALGLAHCRRTLVTEAFSADDLHPERSLGFSPGWHSACKPAQQC